MNKTWPVPSCLRRPVYKHEADKLSAALVEAKLRQITLPSVTNGDRGKTAPRTHKNGKEGKKWEGKQREEEEREWRKKERNTKEKRKKKRGERGKGKERKPKKLIKKKKADEFLRGQPTSTRTHIVPNITHRKSGNFLSLAYPDGQVWLRP